MTEVRPTDPADPRIYFAAERTLLAWIRTGLAMMGFGFVVARFGLFLNELAVVGHMPAPPRLGLSLWFGTALVVAGVIVNLWATVRHVRTMRRLERQEPLRFGVWSLETTIAVALALLGLAMAVYLIFGLGGH